ncbi:hypothetical protein FQN50_001733 [Emmonsiellopsis sp. PD_5]|nr:hypothetical protein FQN50_001733 [Emmonsiellopsis sp. PD_5]
MFVSIAALAIGLGVGLCRASDGCPAWGHHHGGHPGWGDGDDGSSTTATPTDSSATSAPTATSTTLPSDNPSNGNIWTPSPGVNWQINLVDEVKASTHQVSVYDIDLFENQKEGIASLQKGGRKVICYFSAGSYEDWRDDIGKFQDSDLGRGLDGWEGERWLDIRSDNVRNIMLSRLDQAKEKGCDGVDPDNIDGYDNDTGLDLSKDDAIDYIAFLADAAHDRGLSMGLKNGIDIIPQVVKKVEYAVNEQCSQYAECNTYEPFITAKKAVFHIEYPKGEEESNNREVAANVAKNFCETSNIDGFSTVMKNINLDDWAQTC